MSYKQRIYRFGWNVCLALEMPFLGHSSNYTKCNNGERSGGKKWIKTLTGWKPVEQTGEDKLVESNKQAISVESQGRKEEVKTILASSFVKYSKRRQGTSRESSSYTSIGQAMLQMHMVVATENSQCHPFIVQILKLLYDKKTFPNLTVSSQNYLLTVLESLIANVIEAEDNCSNLVICVNDAISNMKEVTKRSPNLHIKKQAHFHLRRVDKLKSYLLHYIETKYSSEISSHLFSLPDDCLRQIVILVKNPVDIFNLGRSCRMLWSLVYQSGMWRDLLRTYSPPHYTQMMEELKLNRVRDEVSVEIAMSAYKRWYSEVFAKLDHSPRMVQLCTICEFLYWQGSEHPCISKTNNSQAMSSIPINPQEFIEMYL